MDIYAPEGTPIYSVASGTVKLAGGVVNTGPDVGDTHHRDCGWFVSILHDSEDPTNGNKLSAHYYHMYQPPLVRTGTASNPSRVIKGQELGGVGKTGFALGGEQNAIDHLHISVNKGLYDWDQSSDRSHDWAFIKPVQQFWPNINFTEYGASMLLTQNEQIDEGLEQGVYFDTWVIDYVGEEEFMDWVDETPMEEISVKQLQEDFAISDQELLDLFESHGLDQIYTDYEVVSLTAMHSSSDLVANVTYKNNMNTSGDALVEILYGGVVYASENITFNGVAGQTISKQYTIQNAAEREYPIEARINHSSISVDVNPHNTKKSLAPLQIAVPQNDFSAAVMQSSEQVAGNTEFNIYVAFINDSYYNGSIPVEILYNGQVISRTITFTGTPFEAVVEEFTINSGTGSGMKIIEARINWSNRSSEDNPANNSLTKSINVLQ